MAEADDEGEEFLDYYDVLGVAWDASDDEIRRAYRKRAREWHPDSNPGDAGAFILLGEAVAVLGDVDKRRKYDTPNPKFDPSTIDFKTVKQGASGLIETVSFRNIGRYIPGARLAVNRNDGDYWKSKVGGLATGLHMLATFDIALRVPADNDLGPFEDAFIVDFEGVVASVRIIANIEEAEPTEADLGSKVGDAVDHSNARRAAGTAARDGYRKVDGDRRRARSSGAPHSPALARKPSKRRPATKSAPSSASVRPARSGRGSIRGIGRTASDAYHFALAYTVTVLVLGGIVGLIGFAATGAALYNLHRVAGGPTQTQLNEAIAVGVGFGLIFAVFWYGKMWRMKYHRRVSETWRSGPLGPIATICVLFLTTVLTVAISPLILLGIALGMIQYN